LAKKWPIFFVAENAASCFSAIQNLSLFSKFAVTKMRSAFINAIFAFSYDD